MLHLHLSQCYPSTWEPRSALSLKAKSVFGLASLTLRVRWDASWVKDHRPLRVSGGQSEPIDRFFPPQPSGPGEISPRLEIMSDKGETDLLYTHTQTKADTHTHACSHTRTITKHTHAHLSEISHVSASRPHPLTTQSVSLNQWDCSRSGLRWKGLWVWPWPLPASRRGGGGRQRCSVCVRELHCYWESLRAELEPRWRGGGNAGRRVEREGYNKARALERRKKLLICVNTYTQTHTLKHTPTTPNPAVSVRAFHILLLPASL